MTRANSKIQGNIFFFQRFVFLIHILKALKMLIALPGIIDIKAILLGT